MPPRENPLTITLSKGACIALLTSLFTIVSTVCGATVKICGDVRAATTAVDDTNKALQSLDARLGRIEGPVLSGLLGMKPPSHSPN